MVKGRWYEFDQMELGSVYCTVKIEQPCLLAKQSKVKYSIATAIAMMQSGDMAPKYLANTTQLHHSNDWSKLFVRLSAGEHVGRRSAQQDEYLGMRKR